MNTYAGIESGRCHRTFRFLGAGIQGIDGRGLRQVNLQGRDTRAGSSEPVGGHVDGGLFGGDEDIEAMGNELPGECSSDPGWTLR